LLEASAGIGELGDLLVAMGRTPDIARDGAKGKRAADDLDFGGDPVALAMWRAMALIVTSILSCLAGSWWRHNRALHDSCCARPSGPVSVRARMPRPAPGKPRLPRLARGQGHVVLWRAMALIVTSILSCLAPRQ
jgi:hypothetical protein